LATSYHADQFEPTLGDGSRWGIELIYVREVEPLGTGGAIRNVAEHLVADPDDPIVILNGDILSSHDLRSQLARHREAAADVSLHLVRVGDPRPFGCVPTDGAGRVTAFLEKDPHPASDQINAGCYVFARRVIDEIPPGRVISVERETFPDLLARGLRVMGHIEDCYWRDVGTPEALRQAGCDLVRGIATSPAYRRAPGSAWLATGAEVAASAVVDGGSAIGERSLVGEGAVVEASVLSAGASVGAGARVIRCVLGQRASVGPGVTVTDQALGDSERVVYSDPCED
jgi:mannose-1-phosphate guanylyltransferase